ncbi:hypothetical protein [Streptomyces sp. H39-C1]|uniref:hypothetical protein n=1 Tax=Streptomyces sp. H39-C1 TaxID=3004355 RepID=UPI0022AFC150|nr:hypothetical protein [Streptomyces sp. H39-C1]MCZ4101801.1 hypothetical protein [Streptomyces sp. H39-C1]
MPGTPYPVMMADDITRQLTQLADHVAHLPPREATQVIARVLDPDNGLLGGVTYLLATSSMFAQHEAERGALPAEVWLALGRGSNELNDIALDLDEHAQTLQRVGMQPPSATAQPPSPAPLVARRRR